MKRLYTYLIISLLPLVALAQNRTITGIVKSSTDGQALPGVSIVIQGTTKGTVSDIDGNFSIEVAPTEKTLDFSFVGFTTKSVSIEGQSQVQVNLDEDTKTLEEVVVVGYGIQKKSDVTGSTATVGGAELMKQPVLTATQALQGKVAGLQVISSGQPGSSPQVRIRGVSTALGGTTALYVVDGVLTDDISNINTADIVSTTVLKDASSAAIYGSRGANGVIIITTKKGANGDLKINYNNNIGIRQATNLVEMADASEYSNYVQAATGQAPPASPYNTDWYGTILRNAWQQTHNVSISGGTEKATYLFNAGYLDDEGIVLNNEFKRLTLRFNQDYVINKVFKFGFQSSFGNSVNQLGFGSVSPDAFGNIGGVYNNAYRAAPIIASRVDGRYGNTSAYQNVGNPLLDLNNSDIRVRENRFQGSSFLEIKPVEWVTFRTSIGGDLRSQLGRGYSYQFNADDQTFLVGGGNQLRSVSSLIVQSKQAFRWVWDNTATLTKQFDKHDFTLLLGTTAEKFNGTFLSANRNDVPADKNLWYIGVGDANTSQNDGSGDGWARNSYLARLNYSYDEKYLLTATLRADGSSRLPGQNRWQQFPSFGLGWILSREGFMQNQELFDLLKLRASYGKVGNDQIPTDAYTLTVALNRAYPFNGSASDATNGSQINQIIDPNINWEITEEYDLALEFGLMESRLTGEVNYYDKRVENALIRVPIPKTVGDADATVITNVASIQNRGIEFLLNWKNRVSDNFSYSVGANATLNDNTVLALNGGQAVLGGGIGAAQGFTTRTDNGYPVGSFFVLQTQGIFNSDAEVSQHTNSEGTIIQPTAKAGQFRYRDVNDDGKIDDQDRVFAGSYQPVAYFGLNGSVTFKSWDISLDFYGNVGNEVYNGKRAVRVEGKDNIEKEVVYDRWTSGGQSQAHPAANVGNLPASDYFVESGSFLRVNNLTVGYNFPVAKLERLRMNSLRVFVTSQNLYTLKAYSGFTPELPGDPTNSGIELSAYPTTRTIAAGINVGF